MIDSKTHDATDSKSELAEERYLSFSLGTEEYAIPLLSVREVIAMPEITKVPQTPPHFLGVMNLRGQVISVVDLRTKLAIKANPTAETAIIICDIKPNSIGVVVDSINSVLNPGADEVSGRPEIQSQRNTEYILGVFRNQDKLVLLLDIAKTLGATDQQIAQQASASKAKAA
jgi:purine-binding chemotaxis protein CheW